MIRSSVCTPRRWRRTLGTSWLGLRVLEHDAAAVGVDPLEDHVHDPRQQLVDVERVADGQGRAVHDLQIAAGPGEPGRGGFVGRRGEDLAPFRLGHRVDDPRAVVLGVAGDDVDLVGQVFDAVFGHAGVEQQRAAELHLVAAGQLVLADLPAVDEGAVRAAQVAEDELVAASREFDVVARDFGVVQLHGVRRAAPDRHQRCRRGGSACPDRDLESRRAKARLKGPPMIRRLSS